MNRKLIYIIFFLGLVSLHAHKVFAGDQITFCGENIPIENDAVANKLITIIKKQVPAAKLADLRRKTDMWFPWIESVLRKAGLPTDLKYLPIVESQFRNQAHSGAGASGLWQIMPETATSYGMLLNPDQRRDPVKSTALACRLLKENYQNIKKITGTGSWTLACAAYNFGIGNIQKAIQKNGRNYFTMHINDETADYVYKIIAFKELWERPERYMNKQFDANVFASTSVLPNKSSIYGKVKTDQGEEIIIEDLGDIEDKESKATYDNKIYDLNYEIYRPLNKKAKKETRDEQSIEAKYEEITGSVLPSKDKFHDGELVSVELDEDMKFSNGDILEKGQTITGEGWVKNGTVHVLFPRGVELLYGNKKGIPLELMSQEGIKVYLKIKTTQ